MNKQGFSSCIIYHFVPDFFVLDSEPVFSNYSVHFISVKDDLKKPRNISMDPP